MSERILGLDIGTNSIGWALVDCDVSQNPRALIAAGVRIFQEAVDAQTRAPKNQARRTKRGMRRNLERRHRRVAKVRHLLMRSGLLPATPDLGPLESSLLNDLGNPYELRAKALDQRLEPAELGRVFLQLAKRRGFLSNRKTKLKELLDDPTLASKVDATESEKAGEESATKEDAEERALVAREIRDLRDRMKSGGFRTLGELLAASYSNDPLRPVRRVHPGREMYEDEFQKICDAQASHHTIVQDPDFRVALHRAIFFQRPLRSQKFLVGKCNFEPSRRRAARARLDVQESRLLQDVNNIQVRDRTTGAYRLLTEEERHKLLTFLETRLTATWKAIRKELGIHSNQPINLEEADKELRCGSTSYRMEKILESTWTEWPRERQEELVEDLLTILDKKALLRRMEQHWAFAPDTAFKLATLELEPGYASLSVKATRAILPHLRAGLNYHDACQAAGYLRRDQVKPTALDRLPLPPQIRNPVVQRALHEVRKVVNAIVRKHGKPALIRVELARDLKLTAKDKDRQLKQNRENEKLNKRAAEALAARGIKEPSPKDLLRYRLWIESRETCPYTGKAIGIEQLFNGSVDIEHILPYSRTLDDSYMNKTLCFVEENRLGKKNQTPYEAYGANAAEYEQILQRIRSLPRSKQRKFEERELGPIDDFVARQLNDTRYASLAARDYLMLLGQPVQVTKGSATALLRAKWDLNRILSVDSSKNRGDHRHHTIDALVIALVSPGVLKRISSASAARDVHGPWDRRMSVVAPWNGFKDEVRGIIRDVIVSHSSARRLSGGLTEETAYGPTSTPGTFAYRKSVEALSWGEIDCIRDVTIRNRLRERTNSLDPKAKPALKKALAEPLFADEERSVPIRKVRLEVKFSRGALLPVLDGNGRAYKYLKLGNNHHVEILEDIATGKWEGRFVSTIEAADRARRRKEPVVQGHEEAGKTFVMSLAINDMVQIGVGASARFFRVQGIKATESNRKLVFREHVAATLDNNSERLIAAVPSLQKLGMQKVVVDPLGEVAPSRE